MNSKYSLLFIFKIGLNYDYSIRIIIIQVPATTLDAIGYCSKIKVLVILETWEVNHYDDKVGYYLC